MSAILKSFRPTQVRMLGLTLAVALSGHSAAAATASPFQKFVGTWTGGGQFIATSGHREAIRCRAEFSVAKAGSALNQAIVCASESFKLNITTYAEAAGETVQGYWREATRDVSGHLTGHIGDGVFDGEISAAAFTASISLTSNGRSQAVSIKPRGGDVSDVRIELGRRT
ncbi:MAG: hypothetical protein JO339_01310 [Alphaproteobacteria bacterium]|nr:hypothetical protein [Alphaproteobacteria bacterium]